MIPSQGLRNCKSYGCTYNEYAPGSEKCLSCLRGIKTGPFGTSASAGAGASMGSPAQPSFQSMFSTPDPQAKGLRITVAPEEINNMFGWLTTSDAPRRARENLAALHASFYLTRASTPNGGVRLPLPPSQQPCSCPSCVCGRRSRRFG